MAKRHSSSLSALQTLLVAAIAEGPALADLDPARREAIREQVLVRTTGGVRGARHAEVSSAAPIEPSAVVVGEARGSATIEDIGASPAEAPERTETIRAASRGGRG